MVDKSEKPAMLVEDACFSHGKQSIFNHVNLAVLPGETLCLLGPNGCGKTTLLDCILGINQLEQGHIFLSGRNTRKLAPSRLARLAAYVPQHQTKHFSFTVHDILLTGRTPYTRFYASPSESDIRRVDQILEDMNMTHLKDRDYTRLSGGESQLVIIMRALIQDTPVILMDEPTAHLDFKHELLVLETIVRLVKERAMTLIMATHFPNHAFFLENAGIPVRVAFMDQTGVYPAGRPSKALTRDNLERFYQVRTSVVVHDIQGKGSLKQIMALETLSPPKS